MQSVIATLVELWRSLRPTPPEGTFRDRLRHIGEEAALATAVLVALAAIHFIADLLEVADVSLVASLKVSDFLKLAHAANMTRLVLLSLGYRVF